MVAPLLLIGGGMAAAGIAGSLLSKKKRTQIDPYNVNEDNYKYGAPEGYANSLGDLSNTMANRNAYNADWSQADYDYYQGQGAREGQMGVASRYEDVLSGKAPSLAQLQMQQGYATNAANAANMANSTRGGNFLLAQRMAQRQNALSGQELAGQTAMLRAKEQEMARAGLASVYGQMRGQDYQARAGSQAQTQANIQNEQFQRQLNQQGQFAALGMQSHAYDAETQARQAYEAAKQNAYYGTATHNAQMNAADNARQSAFWGSMIGMGANMGASGLAASGTGGGPTPPPPQPPPPNQPKQIGHPQGYW